LSLVLSGTGGFVTSREQIIKYLGTGSPTAPALAPTIFASRQGLNVELQTIRNALRLSVAETARLFGVTRPTIYSWQNGNSVSPENAERLREIAQALVPHLRTIEAQVGRVAHRAVEGRLTLLERLTQGEDAREVIDRLASLLNREAAQRERLAHRLQGRTGNRGDADLDALG
jgi:transcriptional regulator with XRE-family HTH domain